MFSAKKRLDKAYNEAKRVTFNDDSKFILFSDCHRGDNSFADDFANNRNIYFHALSHYFSNGFHYCELGDGDELWENRNFHDILYAHKNVFMLMKQFHEAGRLHMIWGNHDMVYRDPNYVEKHLSTYFDEKIGEDVELFCDLQYSEAIVLEHSDTKQEVFLAHGHQADWWNYTFWKWSRFMVRALWKPFQIMGIADPTSPAKNYKNLIKVEKRLKKWIKENDNRLTIVGHTHRPRFPKTNDIALFNDGSCVHPRSITGIEIEKGDISLIKWQVATKEDGTLQIIRVLLEGPTRLYDFSTK